ncbi:MAG TPA: hypothetical protein VMF69_15825 [Gemmataceae bacterium]|nr:hypothetical protein [Gemmataceae bacterium]
MLTNRLSGLAFRPAAGSCTQCPILSYWIGTTLRPDTGHRIRWRGQFHPLRFADTELELDDGSGKCRWPAIVAFSPAPMTYPLLGLAGCLEFFDARFRSADRLAELEKNRVYPGSTS